MVMEAEEVPCFVSINPVGSIDAPVARPSKIVGKNRTGISTATQPCEPRARSRRCAKASRRRKHDERVGRAQRTKDGCRKDTRLSQDTNDGAGRLAARSGAEFGKGTRTSERIIALPTAEVCEVMHPQVYGGFS